MRQFPQENDRKQGKGGFVKRLVRLACMGVLAAVLPAGGAGGDIYWFKDARGVVHLSNVPVDRRYRFKERERPRRPPGLLYEKSSKGYDRLIERVARTEGLDPALLKAVVETESNYDPNAISRKGAVGLMQLMPETARRMGVEDPFRPAENLRAGARHLRRLLDKYGGRIPWALSAYNAGENAVERYRGVPPFPETRLYVERVMAAYRKERERRGAKEPSSGEPPKGTAPGR